MTDIEGITPEGMIHFSSQNLTAQNIPMSAALAQEVSGKSRAEAMEEEL